jgi:hypothetical protein
MSNQDSPDLKPYEDAYTPILKKVDRMARLLDAEFSIPGTNIRFGWDPIIGLIPVVGDVLSMLPQFYMLYIGLRLGVSKGTMLEMLSNILIDGLVGTVPIVGDLIDAAFKSNLRNAQLLSEAIRKKRADLGEL